MLELVLILLSINTRIKIKKNVSKYYDYDYVISCKQRIKWE